MTDDRDATPPVPPAAHLIQMAAASWIAPVLYAAAKLGIADRLADGPQSADELAVATEAGLEPFVERVTLTIPALAAARTVAFLVSGAEKADAARRAFGEAPSPATPASLVRSAEGRTVAILDRAAAAELDLPR